MSNGQSLKFLFVAEFADGSYYEQSADDVSRLFPEKSQFTDILHKAGLHDQFPNEKPVRMTRFSIVCQTDERVVSVDLQSGVFNLNGSEFWVGEFLPAQIQDVRFEPIFYRRHLEHTHIPAKYYNPRSYNAITDVPESHPEYGCLEVINNEGRRDVYPKTAVLYESQQEEDGKTYNVATIYPSGDSQEIYYFIGWKTNIAGKSYSQTIMVA